jgi:hypothetical protein
MVEKLNIVGEEKTIFVMQFLGAKTSLAGAMRKNVEKKMSCGTTFRCVLC